MAIHITESLAAIPIPASCPRLACKALPVDLRHAPNRTIAARVAARQCRVRKRLHRYLKPNRARARGRLHPCCGTVSPFLQRLPDSRECRWRYKVCRSSLPRSGQWITLRVPRAVRTELHLRKALREACLALGLET